MRRAPSRASVRARSRAPRLFEQPAPVATSSGEERRHQTKPRISAVVQPGQDDDIEGQSAQVPVFQDFTTDAKLFEGLCVVRSLGNARFEVMNLSRADVNDLTSHESAQLLTEDQGRIDTLNIVKRDWIDLKWKVEQTFSSANRDIFRLDRLPPELRLRIYVFALIGSKSLKNVKRDEKKMNPKAKTLGLSLMETCRWVYNECRPIFYQNSLEITDVFRTLAPLQSTFRENLYNVTFSWWAFSKKDPRILNFFWTCKNIRIFNLLVTRFAHMTEYHQRQSSHQSENSIKPFNRANGWDQLVSLRGLKKITVRRDPATNSYHDGITLSDVKLQALEDFLMKYVTIPKCVRIPEPEPKPKLKTAKQLADDKRRVKEAQKEVKALRDDNKLQFFQPVKLKSLQPTLTSSRPSRAAAVAASANNTRLLTGIENEDDEEDVQHGESIFL